VADSYVDTVSLRHRWLARAENPARLPRVWPLGPALEFAQDELVGDGTADECSDVCVEVVVAALDRGQGPTRRHARVTGQPIGRVVDLGDVAVERRRAVVLDTQGWPSYPGSGGHPRSAPSAFALSDEQARRVERQRRPVGRDPSLCPRAILPGAALAFVDKLALPTLRSPLRLRAAGFGSPAWSTGERRRRAAARTETTVRRPSASPTAA
jgi:hypothetical protein